MKKIKSHIFFAGVLLLSMASCKKNNEVIDKDVVAPAEAKFNTYAAADTIGRYFIRDVGNTFKIPVGVTNTASVDRTVQINYQSKTGATMGTHYNAPTSFVIPAGSALDSLTVAGIFSAYTATRVDTVNIAIGSGGDIPGAGYKSRYMLIMRKYCDVVLANLGGAYTRTFEGTYGPYTSNVNNLTQTSTTTATATITNIYDSGISATAVFDWTDPAGFKVTIADQQTQYTSGGLPLFVRTNPGMVSTFSSCDNTITLNLQLYTSAGLYDQWTSSMAK